MFLGHYAVALGAKRAAPTVSLGTLFAAAAFLDLLWPVLVLVGVERVTIVPAATAFTPLDFEYYPFSHSLVTSIVWGVFFGGAYYALKRRSRPAIVLGLLVVSHWILDVIVHRPDLPLIPGGATRVGLRLWSSVPGTLAVEIAMFAVGVALYLRAGGDAERAVGVRFWIFVAFLLAVYAAASFGPPPPSASAVAWSDMGQWLVIFWAAWVDRPRTGASRVA